MVYRLRHCVDHKPVPTRQRAASSFFDPNLQCSFPLSHPHSSTAFVIPNTQKSNQAFQTGSVDGGLSLIGLYCWLINIVVIILIHTTCKIVMLVQYVCVSDMVLCVHT